MDTPDQSAHKPHRLLKYPLTQSPSPTSVQDTDRLSHPDPHPAQSNNGLTGYSFDSALDTSVVGLQTPPQPHAGLSLPGFQITGVYIDLSDNQRWFDSNQIGSVVFPWPSINLYSLHIVLDSL